MQGIMGRQREERLEFDRNGHKIKHRSWSEKILVLITSGKVILFCLTKQPKLFAINARQKELSAPKNSLKSCTFDTELKIVLNSQYF